MANTSSRVTFTAGKVAGFKCPPERDQGFLWDIKAAGLGLRVTPTGKPAYVFQSRFQDKTIRVTIGSPEVWSITQAQEKARELQRQIDEGRDPREVKAQITAADVAKREFARAETVTVSEVWELYVAERRDHWGDRHYKDHIQLVKAGGVKSKRGTSGKGVTIDAPLYPLMKLPLGGLDAPTIEAWAAREAKTRPTSARLAWRLLKAFLTWCEDKPEYVHLLPAKNPAKTKKSREALGKPGVKSDDLQRGQLKTWFAAVRGMKSPTIAAYLQTLLLTGARSGEVLNLQWEDINFQWKGMTIRDKVEGERTIPLTPYVAQLLAALPKRSKWVFASPVVQSNRPARMRILKSVNPLKPISVPRNAHVSVCKVAGLEGLTLHGLRRSFKSLSEWQEIPVGVVAQIMGHKPSATAEKHYTIRPLELLAVYHNKMEDWILEHAGVSFDPIAEARYWRSIEGATA